MAVVRTRKQFWGHGPAGREAGGFSFHLLDANAPEEEVQRHTHEEAHFVLTLSGGYMSSAKGAPLISQVPFLVFNPAGTTHTDRFHQGRGTFLAISGGNDQGEAISIADPYALWSARRIAADFVDANSPTLRLEARALQLIASVRRPDGDDRCATTVGPPAWLKSVFEMSFTSGIADLRVADLAAHAGVHPVHLARVFRRYLHCSPGEHLRGRRLERAAALIGSTTASLAQVASATGFVDQAHLTRQFRSAYRSTPAGWRRHRQVAPIQDDDAAKP
jgi:AraC family transcriptional regulator